MKEKMKFIYALILFTAFNQLSFCQSYRDMENIYQADADIIRVHHFDYYAQLLTEYYEKNGKYPFQNEKDAPVYVFILTRFQEKMFKDTNPNKHYTVNDKYFFEELSKGLGRKIKEKYDPQKVAADGRPNMYIYMVDGKNIYFAIHLYYRNQFTKKIGVYYNKMELSNENDVNNKLFTYETLKKDKRYLELTERKADKQGFFDELEEQYKNDSEN